MRKLILITFLLAPFLLEAQDNWETPKTSEMEDSQIIIEKNRQIDLPRATRNFRQIPKIQKDTVSIPVDFKIKEFQPTLNSIKPRIRVLTVKDEKLEKLYANQVRAGLGNYGATYLEAFLANKRNSNQSYGLHFLHESFARGAVDKGNSGSGYQKIQPYGKYITDQFVVEADAFYDRHNNYLYGYDTTFTEVDKDSIQRTFHTIGAHINLKDRDTDNAYQYGFSLDAYQLFTNYNSTEGAIAYDLTNEMELSENFKAYFNSDGFFSKYQFRDKARSNNRNLFRIQPGIVYSNGKFDIKGGFNFVYENDTLQNMNRLHVYPDLSVKYSLLSNLSAMAGLRGDVRAVRMRDLLIENPYLNDSVTLSHTLMPFELYGSLQGSYNNMLGFEAGFSIASVRNNYGFVRLPNDQARFEPLYFDGNNTEININAGLSSQLNKDWHMNLRGDYYYFNISNGINMPYRPNFKIRFNTEYLIADKLTVGLNANLQGKMNAGYPLTPEFVSERQEVEIPAIFDLGLKFNYKLSDRSSVFLNANNLISKEYDYYLNYSNRGFQIMGGFIYSF